MRKLISWIFGLKKDKRKPFYNLRKQDLDYIYKHLDLDAKDVFFKKLE